MLTLNAVSKDIKGVSVLQDINLEFHSGECVLLRGHNGCGKTMLLRLLCGLIRPTGGVITAGGNYRYGVIIENPSFFNGETALYNLRYLANINKIVGVSQIEQVLKSVNLYDVRNKKVRTFSLGMKQRLAICQAVMECPDILLLDEPFNAIDESNLYKVVEILRRQRDDGKLVVVASHGDIPSDNLFSRVIELDSGKIKHDTPS